MQSANKLLGRKLEKWCAKARLVFPEVISGKNGEKNDVKLLERVYSLAEWFFYSTEEDYSNCVAVSFYEHLIDWDETLEAIPTRVPKDIIEKIMPLWKSRSKHHPKRYAKLEMLVNK